VATSAFVLGLALAVAFLVAVALLWITLRTAGVFDSVGNTLTDVLGGDWDPATVLGFPAVMVGALLIALTQVILTTAYVTLLAVLYNATAGTVSGVRVTLTKD
jgi:hypothetical protein